MVIMGHIMGPFGVYGWIKINPYTELIDGLMDYSTWWLGNDNIEWQQVHVTDGHINGQALVVQLREYTDRTQATKLKGLQVAIPRSELPTLSQDGTDGYYWSDLIGVEVINLKGERLGNVVGLFETGANDVLRVQATDREQKEILIPFIEQFVIEVNLKLSRITVDWGIDY